MQLFRCLTCISWPCWYFSSVSRHVLPVLLLPMCLFLAFFRFQMHKEQGRGAEQYIGHTRRFLGGGEPLPPPSSATEQWALSVRSLSFCIVCLYSSWLSPNPRITAIGMPLPLPFAVQPRLGAMASAVPAWANPYATRALERMLLGPSRPPVVVRAPWRASPQSVPLRDASFPLPQRPRP